MSLTFAFLRQKTPRGPRCARQARHYPICFPLVCSFVSLTKEHLHRRVKDALRRRGPCAHGKPAVSSNVWLACPASRAKDVDARRGLLVNLTHACFYHARMARRAQHLRYVRVTNERTTSWISTFLFYN